MPRTRQPIDPEKQARILAASQHEFATHGYRDAKTDDIAAAADVSKGLVFHYFGSKANLYLQTVQATFDKIMAVADLSVWQDSTDLREMVARATRYKLQLQLTYPEEFTLAMAAYAESGNLPEGLRGKVQAIWQRLLSTNVPDMIGPVLARLPLRDGIDPTDVATLVMAMTNLIGEQSKAMLQRNPNMKIDEFEPVIANVMTYMDILEHGFLK
ncbi:TetR/AcrR family transcriptional regulator [Lacticaseibacillus absianus]|uniref:TetR/AcrR family transcriptional regulator n=1 Tax=Lacticaseibacillus absianus TaxID=2729623 RepID=UPI0015C92E27|nr:TetR/AcrR family transcriptional regulator [Lacticaseibacillus absianus]